MFIKTFVIGLIFTGMTISAFSENLPRVNFHKKCEISYVIGNFGITPHSKRIECDGIDMQKDPDIDAWTTYLKQNKFSKVNHKSFSDVNGSVGSVIKAEVDIYVNEDPQPYEPIRADRVNSTRQGLSSTK